MKSPFVSRETLEATEAKVRTAEEQNAALLVENGRLQAANQRLEKAIEDMQAEGRRLMDRVLAMSGQAPLYEAPHAPQAGPVAAPEYDVKKLVQADALPSVGTTFKGVHSAARRAMADGTFDIEKARPRR